MSVIIGLGNPGQTYHGTRHNIGFAVVQQLAQRHQVSMQQRVINPIDGRPAAVVGEYLEGTQTVRLVMPLTMMNQSGEALRVLEVSMQDVLVVCDDVNLPLGTVRVRPTGGAGGHHGLASCLEVVGTEELPRLSIGIGVSELPRDLTEFVLSPFLPSERARVMQAIEEAADACELWSREGVEVAMNRYNRTQDR